MIFTVVYVKVVLITKLFIKLFKSLISILDIMDISQNIPKKRGRRPKNQQVEKIKHTPKKRGRKPKGGKIISQTKQQTCNHQTITNIILHLKCHISELNSDNEIITQQNYTPHINTIESYIEGNSYNFSSVSKYNMEKPEQNVYNDNYLFNEEEKASDVINTNSFLNSNEPDTENIIKYNVIDGKDDGADFDEKQHSSVSHNKDCPNYRLIISEKINKLQHDLTLDNHKSGCACFWCSESFNTEPIYIPKNKNNNNNKYYAYGNFCSPECAVGHLMNEKINESEKFERYHLINYIYGKIFNYTKNIKPAPNPHYVLDKFMGNLTIEEYRKLFEYEKLLLVIDKPLTRVLPQLFEDNDSYKISQRNSKINTFQVKKKTSLSKNQILSNNFGI
jgi:hypothetical protein